MTVVDDFLPTYDVSDSVAVVVEADPSTTWDALLAADLMEVGRRHRSVAALGGLRMLPEIVVGLLHAQLPPSPPEHMTLTDAASISGEAGGWVLLGRNEEAREIALGLVGKFWRPVIKFATVRAEDFRTFDQRGWAKTVYALRAEEVGPGRTLLTGVMRTATTDEHAQKWFRRYWTLGVGSGAHLLVHGLLDVVRDAAEAPPGDRGAPLAQRIPGPEAVA